MPGGKIDILVEPDLRGFDGKLGRGLRGAVGVASTIGKGIGLAMAGGTALAAVGLREVIKVGVEYQGSLNSLQAVTGATAVEMARIGATAKALGADMSLPATSAADAAEAMLELAKGGLTVDQAMQAAKGTLQLAAAAQVDAAEAAEIQSAALNQFGLEASQAGRVADVLANTANAAAGEITDMALALKYVGPVAKSMSISIEDTAAAVGLLANNGIRGENAGTALRGILASLAAPSKEAAGALKTLGIQAFDSQGKFVGLRKVTDDLAKAKGRMTEAAFTEAAATAFGREPLAAVTALAAEGAVSFDEMAAAVARQGGAADVAAAKTKGLGGAWEALKSQTETVFIGIFEAIDGPLEAGTRAVASWLERTGPQIVKGIENVIAAGEAFGPLLAKAIEQRADAVGDAIEAIFRPLVKPALEALNTGLNTGIALFEDFTGALKSGADAAKPVARGIADVATAATAGTGILSVLGGGLELLGDAAGVAANLLVPLGSIVGGLLSAFADLPGPIQTAVLALTAYKLLLPSISNTGVVSTLKQFSGEMAVQRQLAAASGQEMGRLASATAAFHTSTIPAVAAAKGFADQTSAIRAGATAAGTPITAMGAAIGTLVERVPVLTAMRGAFESAAAGATRFGTAAGIAAAAGTGLRAIGSGLLAAIGGPFGLAIAGAAVGLSFWADSNAKAEAKARAHSQSVSNLADALRKSNGAIDDSVRAMRLKELQDSKAIETGKRFGITVGELIDASLKQGNAFDVQKAKLEAIIKANEIYTEGVKSGLPVATGKYNEAGQAAQKLLADLTDMASGTDEAARKNKELDEAVRSGKAGMLQATESGRTLSSAMGVLADKTSSADDKARALKAAMDALSGGAISYDQSVARFQESIGRLGKGFAEAVAQAKEFGKSLVGADGSINTSLPKGRELLTIVGDLSTNMAESAQKAFEMAGGINNIGPATAAAKAKLEEGRQAIIDAGRAAGFNEQETQRMIERYGFVPDLVATLITQPGMDKAQLELLLLQQAVHAVPGQKTISTTVPLSEEAQRKLEAVGIRVERIKDSKEIRLTALDGDFNAAVARAVAPATKTVTIRARTVGTLGGLGADFAHGGIAMAAYASGGIHRKLTPMPTGIARIVPPNTWRVVGDRLRDDEAYIPINRSLRSQQLLETTASRMGYALIRRFAEGGFASSREPVLVGAQSVSGPTITNNVVVQRNEDAATAARVLSERQAWQFRGGRS